MVRSLGELGETRPRRREARKYPPAPPRFCYYCGKPLGRGMSVRDKRGFRCRRPCTLWPVTGEPDE